MKTLWKDSWNIGLLSLILVLFPLNLFSNLAPDSAYVHGLQVDYLLPKLYLSQVLIAGLLFTSFIQFVVNESNFLKKTHSSVSKKSAMSNRMIPTLPPTKNLLKKIAKTFRANSWLTLTLLLTSCYLLFTTLTVEYPLAALSFVFQTGLNVLFGVWLVKHRHFFQRRLIQYTLLLSYAAQVVVGLLQFFLQRAMFPYQFFGETQIQSQIGIAKTNFTVFDQLFGTHFGLQLSPYGTFPHPQLLAGFLVLVFGILLFTSKFTPGLKVVVFFTTLLMLVLTGSFSALIVVMLLCLLFYFKGKISVRPTVICGTLLSALLLVPLLIFSLTFISADSSITRRHVLHQAAVSMIQGNFLFGVGPNQFTAHVEEYLPAKEVTRFVQPVHHVPLLLLSEVGIVGAIIVVFWMYVGKEKFPVSSNVRMQLLTAACCLLPMLVLDHYLYTLHQGQLLCIVYGIIVASSVTNTEGSV